MLVTYTSKMKAFLIACILLATIVFSPLSTCSARELAGRGGSNNPYKPVFSCGRGKRYCVPKTPPPCRATYKRNC
ncbi:hypothetical protein NC651_037351 [Populus alba x Populus x berolinensis]|nr:hypothetical protein NC651_037351 [Populus alba x Populus x berolinensis]